MKTLASKYGPEFAGSPGWIAEVAEGEFRHRFGGSSWEVFAPERGLEPPALIAVLDAADPRLDTLQLGGIGELPLFSFVNCQAWLDEQEFRLDFDAKRATLLTPASGATFEASADEDCLPVPLPERPLRLREMTPDEYPIDEASYWSANDGFLGGDSFIRVGGPPLWLDFPPEPPSVDGRPMQFVMALGYENWDGPHRLLDDRPFFLGEAALYWFFDRQSSQLRVISQPT